MATNVWLGAAVNVPHVQTFAIGGTWVAAETLTLTINGKDLVLTIGTGQTALTAILDDIVAMVNGDAVNGTETRNAIGSEIGEWSQITATEDGATVITLTGKSDGQEFTCTTAETSTSGTIASPSTATTGTGGGDASSTDNWSEGSLPVDGDTIVFDHRAAVGMKYNLDALAAVTPASIVVDNGFKYEIGLPDVNRDATAYPYNEYRTTDFSLCAAADATNTQITVDSSNCRRLRINTQDGQCTLLVNSTGGRQEATVPAMLWKGTHANNAVTVNKGDVGIAIGDGESATVETLNVNYRSNVNGDATVECGDGVTLTTISQAAGTLAIQSNVTTFTQTGGICSFKSGTGTAATMGTLKVYAGTFNYESTGTATSVTVIGNGTMDMRNDSNGRTFSAIVLHSGASFYDPEGTVTASAGYDFYECAPEDCVFEVVKHRTWTPTGI